MSKSTRYALCVGIALASALVFAACNHGFLKDPRLYNPKRGSVGGAGTPPVSGGKLDLDLTGGVDPFDKTDEWYNKPDCNGDEDNKDKTGFSSDEFKTLGLVGLFDGNNVPSYSVKTDGVSWTAGDAAKREFKWAGAPDTKGKGYTISGMTYYRYDGRNPLYDDESYNTPLQVTAKGNPKLSRFYFYRFTGTSVGQGLDNYLIAVDSYSKLVFAFAKPIENRNILGNEIPTKWGPTDLDPYIGTRYMFYEYDPVGYMSKEGGAITVTLYQWFKDALAKGDYQPKVGAQGDTVAKKTPEGAGKTPFNAHSKDLFQENVKLLHGKTFQRREKTDDGSDGLVLYNYSVNSDGTTITRTAASWHHLPTTTSMDTVTYTVGTPGKSATTGPISGGSGAKYLELADESNTLVFYDENGNELERASAGFADPGPSLPERVKGATFKNTEENTTYTFSADGRQLTFKYIKWGGGEGTVTYEYRPEKERGSYADGGKGYAYAVYGRRFVDLTGGDASIRIEDSGLSMDGAGLAAWYRDATMGYPATRIIEEKDSFTANVAGYEFSLRERDSDGLYTDTLVSYVFSADGKSADVVTKTWNGGSTKSTVSVADGSGKTGGTVNSQPATLRIPAEGEGGNWTLTVDDKTYTLNYDDPGPSFPHRVKGKTYVGDEVFYVFSADGRTLHYYDTYWSWGGRKWQKRDYTYDSGTAEERTGTGIQAKYGGSWYTWDLSDNKEEMSWWESYAYPKKDKAAYNPHATPPAVD